MINARRKLMPKLPTTPNPTILRGIRRFLVVHDNAKVHGRFPIQIRTSEGCLFTSGRCVIDTDLERKGFIGMGELEDVLGAWGNVTVEFID